MAHYIDKDAALAEIDKVMAEEMKFYETACKEGDEEISSSPMVYTRLQILRSFINTLEVKEVDIEKKKMEWIEQLCKYFKANYLYVSGHESFISDFRMYAKNLK